MIFYVTGVSVFAKMLLISSSLAVLITAITVSSVPQRFNSYTKLTQNELAHLQSRGFRTRTQSNHRIDDGSLYSTAASQDRPSVYDDSYIYPNSISNQQPQSQYIAKNHNQKVVKILKGKVLKEKEEEEIEEPDRLSLLLPQSKFNCVDKSTGYYADEELGCEVFHYCQDNTKHSWICPDGFTFHQVHLICMPPGADNICEKSSQYHFINDYLYKPINLDEYQQRPNTSLVYSERYYPDNIYHEDSQTANTHRNSHRVEQPPKQIILAQIAKHSYRPEATVTSQVFRAPSEVNIPLQQRRPVYINQRVIAESEEE